MGSVSFRATPSGASKGRRPVGLVAACHKGPSGRGPAAIRFSSPSSPPNARKQKSIQSRPYLAPTRILKTVASPRPPMRPPLSTVWRGEKYIVGFAFPGRCPGLQTLRHYVAEKTKLGSLLFAFNFSTAQLLNLSTTLLGAPAEKSDKGQTRKWRVPSTITKPLRNVVTKRQSQETVPYNCSSRVPPNRSLTLATTLPWGAPGRGCRRTAGPQAGGYFPHRKAFSLYFVFFK